MAQERAGNPSARDRLQRQADVGQDGTAGCELCNEWMAKRMAIVVREQEMFANCWVWLLADMSEQPWAACSKPPDECVG
jgi:hypothetical protein